MIELRNWIERAIGKQWLYPPIFIGRRLGRKHYVITWADGTEGDYYIDYEAQTIEEVI